MPTHPCSAGVTHIPYALPMNVGGWTFGDVELVAKKLPLRLTGRAAAVAHCVFGDGDPADYPEVFGETRPAVVEAARG